MANRKKTSVHQKNLYKRYAETGRQHKNRLERLETYVKHNPADTQAAAALKRLKAKTPKEAYRRNSFKGNGLRVEETYTEKKKGKEPVTLKRWVPFDVKAARSQANAWNAHKDSEMYQLGIHDVSFAEKYAFAILDFANRGNKVKGFKKAEKVAKEAFNV